MVTRRRTARRGRSTQLIGSCGVPRRRHRVANLAPSLALLLGEGDKGRGGEKVLWLSCRFGVILGVKFWVAVRMESGARRKNGRPLAAVPPSCSAARRAACSPRGRTCGDILPARSGRWERCAG
jgi:hypothetical protein